jgi:hypothetical protein
MINKWTPEPWCVVRDPSHFHTLSSVVGGDDGNGNPISIAEFGGTAESQQPNALRAVQCVNACKDLADPAAEIKAMREKIERLEACVRAMDEMEAARRVPHAMTGNIPGHITLKPYLSNVALATHAYDTARARVTLPPSPTDFPAQEKAGKQATVDDGFGTSADKCGDDCTLQVVRPGDIRCDGSGAKCANKNTSDGAGEGGGNAAT